MSISLSSKHGNIDLYKSRSPIVSEITAYLAELRIINTNIDENSDPENLELLILRRKTICTALKNLFRRAREENVLSDVPPLYRFCR